MFENLSDRLLDIAGHYRSHELSERDMAKLDTAMFLLDHILDEVWKNLRD